MERAETWRALFRSEDLGKTRVVATCVAAMEYEVRVHGRTGPIDELSDDEMPLSPFEVRVPAEDWPQLAEILDELIDEQEQFDDFVDSLERRISRSERRLLVTMIVIVSALAVAGAIDL